ncbi:bifunctional threonine ammonia-lyase/L-serine ammonia-lyase TdcB [Listeria fleischmannii]|uniref:L-threonine dehydratase catabolic TdcB n=1 Tax=Listeria fleischmannii TaxID=1069827 RepID=A0A841YEJ9_9LIST|nr:bifunctional threonine ammonia-lyase/L-serine ammonia-lyase TdcB [Listeria fleischmannii]EIA20610.1 threonine dehydratase [Listeria fleischmannii subsp. coloradonensis]MBC1398696.1 bifunctional threonine ammonia-lyase/L-serine ammonia-lyase TdcB [Listeria fleischmannii]MBC1418187.1 bifunctional threonine ammonia-lyase/L-serine ammonia-lyase TdcB [Listeria fleischmannii]MBC1426960.1 bifunctional threonine ammonia-lyase/L-serine ammonia-lyase TdcB [Listeria fleischmannii]STY35959.1 L-threonin
MNTDHYVSIRDIQRAREVLQNNARVTPLVKSFYLTSITGADAYLKLENMQLTGSFKFRGAYNKISTLTKEEREQGVIACSAGNHAQGVALSSRLQGIKSTIVMPETAPQAKIDATRGYGSEVILFGATFDDAKAKCEEIVKTSGQTFLHPYDDTSVIAGQGTIGLEILDSMWNVDTVIAPIGGGGLISGLAVALKSFNPNIHIIGVQAENVHGMKASFDAGKIISHYTAPTMADGCAVKVPGVITFEIVRELVDTIVTVTEDELESAMKDLLQRGKAVVEGAGALSTAALVSEKTRKYVEGKKVVSLISGGNVDLKRISQICEHFYSEEYVH